MHVRPLARGAGADPDRPRCASARCSTRQPTPVDPPGSVRCCRKRTADPADLGSANMTPAGWGRPTNTEAGYMVNNHELGVVLTDEERVLDALVPWRRPITRFSGNDRSHVRRGASDHADHSGLNLGSVHGVGEPAKTVRGQIVHELEEARLIASFLLASLCISSWLLACSLKSSSGPPVAPTRRPAQLHSLSTSRHGHAAH